MQNTDTGRKGNMFGRCIAKQFAEQMGLVLNGNSNECRYDEEDSVIKSARINNSKVGICITTLQKVENVILLKEVENNKFAVHICKIERCITDGKPTASKGKAKNFSVNTIIQNGKQIGTFIYTDINGVV